MVEVLQDDAYDVTYTAVRAVGVRHLRDEQQDAAVVTGWLCAIADGLGGHDRGAVAAQVAFRVLAGQVDDSRDADGLCADIAVANQAVRALALTRYRNPATTLVALAVAPDAGGLVGAWCGDSRAWLVTVDGAVSLLSTDHVDHWGGILRCLGEHVADDVSSQPDTFVVSAGHAHRVLLTTDGVHGNLWGDEIEVALAKGLDALVAAGTARNTDNATAMLVDVDRFVADCGSATPAR